MALFATTYEIMLKQISWKYYLIFVVIVSIISLFFDYNITIGIILGTLVYFLNLKLAEKKFPNLNDKTKAISGALLVISLQGILTVVMALATWFIGKLPCFLTGFVSMIVPNIYFFIFGGRK